MKNRIIIDFNIDADLSGKEIEILKDDIKDLIENHEFTYYANNVFVEFQDEYCIKQATRTSKERGGEK